MQQISIDEGFLDVSDDPRGGEQASSQMRAEILNQFKLQTSWGIATNKLVAKIATEVGKPRGLVCGSSGKGGLLPVAASGEHDVGCGTPIVPAICEAGYPNDRRSRRDARASTTAALLLTRHRSCIEGKGDR